MIEMIEPVETAPEEATYWTWFQVGDESVPVCSSEGQAAGEAECSIDNNFEPGEEISYNLAKMKGPFECLPSAERIGEYVFEWLDEWLQDEMAAESAPLEMPTQAIESLGQVVIDHLRKHGSSNWYTVNDKTVATRTYVSGSNDGDLP